MRFRIVVAYDGTEFVGWQRQASGVSIQGLLEGALRELDGRDVAVTGAGRTDAGVHALGQVAAFSLERTIAPDVVMRALNARLPDAVRVLSTAEAPAGFHPRFDARSKTYRYRLCVSPVLSPFERRYAWHVGPLDVEAMCAAARRIEGRHDFAAFQSAGSEVATTVREISESRIADCGLRIDCGLGIDSELRIDCGVGIDGELRIDCGTGIDGELRIDGESAIDSGSNPSSTNQSAISNPQIANQSAISNPQIANKSAIRNPQSAILAYHIRGDGFLRHMVRSIVGTLVEIGYGRRPVSWIDEVIASRDRAAAGPTAPAAGLFLVSVDYDLPCAESKGQS